MDEFAFHHHQQVFGWGIAQKIDFSDFLWDRNALPGLPYPTLQRAFSDDSYLREITGDDLFKPDSCFVRKRLKRCPNDRILPLHRNLPEDRILDQLEEALLGHRFRPD